MVSAGSFCIVPIALPLFGPGGILLSERDEIFMGKLFEYAERIKIRKRGEGTYDEAVCNRGSKSLG